jgi:hypothetical protein
MTDSSSVTKLDRLNVLLEKVASYILIKCSVRNIVEETACLAKLKCYVVNHSIRFTFLGVLFFSEADLLHYMRMV